MAHDPELAWRIREELGGVAEVSEMRMFGGLAFLVGGHLAVAASGQGGILVRVGPAESEALMLCTPAEVMEMRGRPMPGWLRLGAQDVADQDRLAEWVDRGVAYARSLPPKVPGTKPGRGKARRK